MIEHARGLIDAGVPVVLAGDYNVVPTPADIYPTRSWDHDALVQPASRERFKQLVEQGWIDAIRSLHPNEPMYTFWDYKRGRWGRDAGLRIDHLLISPALSSRILDAGVDKAIRGDAGASDHAPAWVLLKSPRKKI
jgi:exodeoxyribonuclease-3